ncbi:MAG TPA: hypothetical protein VNZ86_07550 [Bacteroidia bacterium]|jgi:hypothetical protein|nr:hypothetical protein [Bacteroidia bacterium]
MNELTVSKEVLRLQKEVSNLPQYEPKTDHYFADGMYCRSVFRHKGVVVVGKVHKKEHFYIISRGKVAVTGCGLDKIYEAGDVIISKPGTKRAVYAMEDSICVTVHRISCESKDIEEIERELVEEEPESMYSAGNILKVPCVEKEEIKVLE